MSSLCLSCGLCCDGTIFDWSPLAPNDDIEVLRGAGISVTMVGGERRFAHPCPAHGGECRVYATRPAACRTYRCKLLRREQEGTIDRGEALQVIGEAVRSSRSLFHAIREIGSDDAGRKSRPGLLARLLEQLDQCSEPEMRRQLGSVVVQILALDGFLHRHFGESFIEWPQPVSRT